MKFTKEWCYGRLNGRNGDDDFVVAYHCENGKVIEVKFLISNQSFKDYVVDGRGYTTLKEAKAACTM